MGEFYGANDDVYIDEWTPDPAVSCALPDLQWVVWTALGAAVVVVALGWWVVRSLRVNPR